MNPFDQGWSDRLRELPPRAAFERAKTLRRVQYERGRHVASMWLLYVAAQAQTASPMPEQRRTLHKRDDPLCWTYKRAFKAMPLQLRTIIFEEERFCSLQSELLGANG